MDQLNEAAIAELTALCPGGVARDVDLSAISRWRIGGRADLVLRPSSTAEVSALMRWFSAQGIRPVVIGLTSNLLFDDAGLRAPCIQIGERMAHVNIKGQQAWAQAGAWVPGFARKLMQAWLSGAEHICGIPGTLGGLICMNGGSQRKGIGSSIVEVESVDATGKVRNRPAQDCAFGYRQSVFQTNGEIITAASLRFSSRPRAEIRSEMRTILAERRRKFPRKEPNCGSVFKSNPAMYAEIGPPGAAIERLGFKGAREGGALVSPQHANFIVNTGRATATEVLTLIARIGSAVEAATGYRMAAEACFVQADGTIQPADTVLNEITI
ncbi:UDP-N-acetylmuramate dehydrogenase [Maritimibacter sp. HL-12]|uniref:UDP-N-acetylmuramate dehydrogenase n=1 Tax=Maritimibacter sp. HL-12 TaxID=1162418 RepID=UPI000A0F3E49|nr:UDP-N-acetylmuramate dehydrogenase [Maritimibacter sp. HL-12]SMH56159.1 UDP-N-acetylmuramate dehydrogenase [Maritimibacter sp. HL-12]